MVSYQVAAEERCMASKSTVVLYRPVGQSELDAIRASDRQAFPPRESGQQMFCPLLTEEDAIRIARDWNAHDARCGYAGYVVKFRVSSAHLKRFEVNALGRKDGREHWIPSKDLGDFNSHIVGPIEVIHEFHRKKSGR
jgi:hypothetical protein